MSGEQRGPEAPQRSAAEQPASLPATLDFYPLQGEGETGVSRFYANLREGRLTSTKCLTCGKLDWPPRIVCSGCLGRELQWVDLPTTGTVFTFTDLFIGAPLGMEDRLPMVLAMVKLAGSDRMIYSEIEGAEPGSVAIGDAMVLTTYTLTDGRIFFRFKPQRT